MSPNIEDMSFGDSHAGELRRRHDRLHLEQQLIRAKGDVVVLHACHEGACNGRRSIFHRARVRKTICAPYDFRNAADIKTASDLDALANSCKSPGVLR